MGFKKTLKQAAITAIMTLLCVCHVCAAETGDGYVYEAASNTYTISQTSGNITEALDNALTAATGTVANPATIRIQGGTYSIALVKIQKSNIIIDATDATISFIGSSASGQYVLKATDTSVSNVTIKGGTWDGKGIASIVFHFAGESVKPSNLTFKDCTVKGANDSNIRLANATNVTMNGVTVSGSNYGMMIKNCKNIKFTGCKTTGNNIGYGVRESGGDNVFTDCTVTANAIDGLQVKDVGTMLTLKGGNYIKNGKNGISATTGATLIMDGVNVSDNKSNGISPVGSKTTTTTVKITNSTFNNNGRHGVAADSYITITMDHCIANGNVSNGIILNKGCKSSGLTNITAKQNGASGILVQGNSTCKMISDVVCNNNKKLGISLENVTITLTNCEANKNKKHGVFISGAKENTITMKNCEANENGSIGIIVANTGTKKKLVVSKTRTCENGVSGLESYAKTTQITGKGNEVKDNKKHGIVARNGKLNVSKAVVTGNGAIGVFYVGKKTGGYCTNSTISNNKSGITLSEGATVSKIQSNTFENNSQYGICLYEGVASKKTTLKNCKKNTFIGGKSSTRFIVYWEGVSVPSKLKPTKVLTIAGSVKKGKSKITGTFTAGSKVSVKIDGKTYTAKANSAGKYTIKTKKLKAGTKLSVYAQDSYKNKFMAEKTL